MLQVRRGASKCLAGFHTSAKIRNMRIRALLPAGLLLLAASTLNAAEVVVYSAHGADIQSDFVSAFETARPGTTVRWLDMGAAEILDRVRAEKGNPKAHVWWGAPATFFVLAGREGLLEPYRPTWADAVAPYARGEGDLWFGQFDLPIGIGYVPGRLPEEDLPREWDDLVAEGAKGRFVLRDPPASGTMKTFLAAMVARAETEEAGFDWLRRLHARTASYTATPEIMFQKLTRGEADLTVWNVTDLLFQAEAHDRPLAAIVPAGGVPVITDGIALVKGAGDEAKAFYEFVTSVPSNLALAKDHYRFPTRRDLPAEEMPAWTADVSFTALDLDRERMVASMEIWTARWDRDVRGGGRGSPWLPVAFVLAVGFIVGGIFAERKRRRAHEDV